MFTTPATINTPGAAAAAPRLSTWQYRPLSVGFALSWTRNVLVKACVGPCAVLVLPSHRITPSLSAVRKRTLRVSPGAAAARVPDSACPASQLPVWRRDAAGVQAVASGR